MIMYVAIYFALHFPKFFQGTKWVLKKNGEDTNLNNLIRKKYDIHIYVDLLKASYQESLICLCTVVISDWTGR